MEIIIDTSKPLDWNAIDNDRITQNVSNLVRTFRYDVAYDRTMGIDPGILSQPATVAESLYITDIMQLIAEYEPRCIVKEVDVLSIDEDGNISARVVIEI